MRSRAPAFRAPVSNGRPERTCTPMREDETAWQVPYEVSEYPQPRSSPAPTRRSVRHVPLMQVARIVPIFHPGCTCSPHECSSRPPPTDVAPVTLIYGVPTRPQWIAPIEDEQTISWPGSGSVGPDLCWSPVRIRLKRAPAPAHRLVGVLVGRRGRGTYFHSQSSSGLVVTSSSGHSFII